ncbi:MAG TPA: hydroxymethylbilane synthase [Terriglobales bacterium]|nr:hydroxymethylbilane synthase [Terriglobales bacterium]
MAHLRIGSRGSQLALWQANHISALLQQQGHVVSIEVIKTTGDKITDVALAKVGTKGMFTKEIEEAMLEGRVDLAVHSLKDLPTELSPDFVLAAVPEREDPRDAFLSKKYSDIRELPKQARVGTSSLRRQAQLRALRKDLEIIPLRGNVDTRFRKLQAGEFDAIILAAAGLTRLGLRDAIREYFGPDEVCPAAGQGALAIETRADDLGTAAALKFLDHGPTRNAIACERATLNGLGGGCQVPIGAYAQVQGRELLLQAVVASPDGRELIREQRSGSDPQKLGIEVARELLARGAQHILEAVYGREASIPQQP